MYALSTCAWCKKTKKFLKASNIEHEYVDVDLADQETQEKIRNDILSMGGRLAYPTTIVDGKTLIYGFLEDDLKKALGI